MANNFNNLADVVSIATTKMADVYVEGVDAFTGLSKADRLAVASIALNARQFVEYYDKLKAAADADEETESCELNRSIEVHGGF